MAAKNEKFIRFRMDKDWARNLLDQPGVYDAVSDKTYDVLDKAREIAANEAYDKGDYANSFREDFVRSRNNDRVVGRVITDDPKWAYIEYGTRNNRAIHTLKRAVKESDLGNGNWGGNAGRPGARK